VASDEDASRPPDWARLRASAEASDCIEILGPPPFSERAATGQPEPSVRRPGR
jgi:hypothetical protein